MYYQLQVLIFRLATAYLTSLASVSDFGKATKDLVQWLVHDGYLMRDDEYPVMNDG